MGLSIFDETRPYTYGTTYLAAYGLISVGITSNEELSRRIDTVSMSNTDTIVHVVDINQSIGGTSFLIGSATIPIGAGIGGQPSFDVLAASQPATQTNLVLAPGDSLTFTIEVALNAGKQITAVTRGGYV